MHLRKNLLVHGALGAFLLASAQVQAEPQFAVLKTEKSCGINIPDSVKASPYYFSKDCQTAYILPGRSIPIRVSKPIPNIGATDQYCSDFFDTYTRAKEKRHLIDLLENNIEKLLETDLSKLSPQEAKQVSDQIKMINGQILVYQASIQKSMKQFDETTALTALVTVGFDQTDQIKAFQQVNNGMVSSDLVYPTRFVAANIVNGIIAFSGKNEDAKVLGDSITDIQFPGLVPQLEGNLKQPNTKYVRMNGELSGKVSISASAYCSKKRLQPQSNDIDILASVVAINANYDVKVQAGMKVNISANISTKDFLRSLQNKIVNGKYNRNEFIDHIVVGGLSSGLYIELDDSGETKNFDSLFVVNEDDSSNPIAKIAGQVISSFITNAEAKLEQLGIVEKLDNVKAKEIPAADVDVRVGDRKVCSSSSSWWGLSRSEHCTTEPVYIKVSADGISTILQNNIDNSFIEQKVQYSTNETIKVSHNSSFVYVGEKNENR